MQSRLDLITTTTASTLQSIYSPIKKAVSNFIVNTFDGFSRAFFPSIITKLMRSQKARAEFQQIVSANLMYLGSVMLFEVGIQNARWYLPCVETYGINYAVEMLARLYFTRTMAKMYVDNTLENACVSKTVADSVANDAKANAFAPCECGTTAQLQASLASPLYYISNMAMVYFVSKLPYGNYLSIPMRMLAYGQCFLDYKLGSIGMCNKHRYEAMTSNNAYALGIGSAFELSQWIGNKAIQQLTHSGSYFAEDALFSLLFPYFIIMAHLIDEPLPGRRPGLDLFFPGRLFFEDLVKAGSDKVVNYVRDNLEQGDLIKALQKIAESDAVKIIEFMLLSDTIHSINELHKFPMLKKYLQLNEFMIREVIKGISLTRMTPYLGKALAASHYLKPVLPNYLASERQLLQIIFNENTPRVLQLLSSIMMRLQLGDLSEKKESTLLSQQEKIEIVARIHAQIDKLQPPKEEYKEEIDNYANKVKALCELALQVHHATAETPLLKMLEDWKKTHNAVINQHSNYFSKFVKQTETAKFVEELKEFIDDAQKPTSAWEADDVANQLGVLINRRIRLLQSMIAKMQGHNYLRSAKITAFTELEKLIEEYSDKVSLNKIVEAWKEYYGHIINADRNVSSRVLKEIGKKNNETDSSAFMELLLEDYNNPFKNNDDRKEAPADDASEKIISHISKKIETLLQRKNKLSENKIKALIELMHSLTQHDSHISFRQILKPWKKRYWDVINMHQSNGAGLMNDLFGSVVGENKLTQTETATFINALEKEFGDCILPPRIAQENVMSINKSN